VSAIFSTRLGRAKKKTPFCCTSWYVRMSTGSDQINRAGVDGVRRSFVLAAIYYYLTHVRRSILSRVCRKTATRQNGIQSRRVEFNLESLFFRIFSQEDTVCRMIKLGYNVQRLPAKLCPTVKRISLFSCDAYKRVNFRVEKNRRKQTGYESTDS